MLEKTQKIGDATAPVGKYYPNGSLIARRYLVESCLGAGSAGTVYLCHDQYDTTAVTAIKILTNLSLNSPVFTRFYREATIARKIRSPYVVSSFDLITDDGVFAYTMEYVKGRNLAELLQAMPLPPLPLVYRALWEISQGLEAIHAHGVVHRDLKPPNVLITEDLHFKITDFGIVQTRDIEQEGKKKSFLKRVRSLSSRQGESSSSRLTGHGELLGTIDYLSPEYIAYDTVDVRSDIYSLGTLGFKMLTGKLPFEGPTMKRLVSRVKSAPPNLTTLRPDVPLPIRKLLMRCLDRNPDSRPQSAQEFVAELEKALEAAEMLEGQ